MINCLFKHIIKYTKNNPSLLNFININSRQQLKIIHNHLLLANHGLGHPHDFWEIGEKLLNVWLETLNEFQDNIVKNGLSDYKQKLSEFYKKESEIIFNNTKNYNKLLKDLSYPLGEKNIFAECNYTNIINSFTFIDLFAGIGGFHQAMHSVGGHCVFASEIDKHARLSYEANYKKIAPNLFENNYNLFNTDINDANPDLIPDFDICCGGFPCQAFSIAGLKRGFEDTRGTLFFNIANIVKHKKEQGHAPKVLFLENVKGLKMHDKGNTLNIILKTLEELGYAYRYEILNAKYFGIPQNRERLFIVAWDINQIPNADFRFPYGIDKEGNTIFDKKDVAQKAKETHISDIFEPRETMDSKFTISDRMWIGHQERKKRNKENGKGFGYSLFRPESTYSSTISARYWKDGSEILIDQSEYGLNPRKLTPVEAGRLQGYNIEGKGWENPNTGLTTHEQIPYKIVVSQKEAYQQFGNSVAVPVIKRISQEIVKQLIYR